MYNNPILSLNLSVVSQKLLCRVGFSCGMDSVRPITEINSFGPQYSTSDNYV